MNILVKTIDNQKEIELSIDDYDNDNKKLELVIDTLQSIFDKYNVNITSGNIISEKEEDLSNDLPFWFIFTIYY